MRLTRSFCGGILIAWLVLPATSSLAASSTVRVPGITRSAREYMAAIDAGDLDRQMAFWSSDGAATSVIMGQIWTGPAAIRRRSAEYVPVSKLMRNELGEISVVPIGSAAAISIVPCRPVRRDPSATRLAPFELDSMLTLIWTKTPVGWRILHEHVSVNVPPPGGVGSQ